MQTLINSAGREYRTDSAIEIVNMQAQGWRLKPETQPEPKPEPKPVARNEGKS